MIRCKLSLKAQEDLENIWLYTFKNWSIEQANRYINLIMDEVEFICLNPKFGVDYSHVKEGYYKARVKSHFIFYKINQSNDSIEVIRILNQKMDIDNRLNQ